MNGLAWMVCLASLGVDYGWQPTADGQLEYIIQIEPEQVDALLEGQEVLSEIHPDAGQVRLFRVRIGKDELPRQSVSPPTDDGNHPDPDRTDPGKPSPRALTGTIRDVTPPSMRIDDPAAGSDRGSRFAPDRPFVPQAAPWKGAAAGDNDTGRFPQQADDDVGGQGESEIPAGNAIPALQPQAPTPIPDPDAAVGQPSSSLAPPPDFGESAAPLARPAQLPEMLEDQPVSSNRLANYTEEPQLPEPENRNPPATSDPGKHDLPAARSPSTPAGRPWLPLTLTALGLFASLGTNLYLGWITCGFYRRYRDVLGQLLALGGER